MSKKLFHDYKVEDFVSDESFINYHLRLNESDVRFWNNWVSQNPSQKLMIIQAKEIINSFSMSISVREYSSQLEKIKLAINKEPESIVKDVTPSSNLRRIRRNLMIAASAMSVILISGLFIKSLLIKPLPVNRVISSKTSFLKFTLSDSTVVTLAPNSSLQFPSYFTGNNRQVYLKGEANFQVTHDARFPFKVHATNIVTTVLGTVFNIKQSGDSAVVVELLKGRVNVAIDDSAMSSIHPIILYPNEKAVYVFHNKLFFKYNNELRYSLSFQRSSFKEISIRIKELYGRTVINNSDKKDWRFTGQFNNQSAEDILANICLIKGLHSKKSGDTIIITN